MIACKIIYDTLLQTEGRISLETRRDQHWPHWSAIPSNRLIQTSHRKGKTQIDKRPGSNHERWRGSRTRRSRTQYVCDNGVIPWFSSHELMTLINNRHRDLRLDCTGRVGRWIRQGTRVHAGFWSPMELGAFQPPRVTWVIRLTSPHLP